MITGSDEIKRLYQDAFYYHLIRQGFSKKKAEMESKKAF